MTFCANARFSFPQRKFKSSSQRFVTYYAAGSVQGFAREFLECSVRVFSAWRANAVPVAEYTAAQIILAAKGYCMAQRHTGNYHATIGIVGAGAIGSLICQKLHEPVHGTAGSKR